MSHNPDSYARWYAKNAEKKRAQVKARYQAKRDEILEAERARRSANADEINAKRRAEYTGEKRVRVLAQVRAYQSRNSEAVSVKRRAHYADNRDQMLKRSKQYRQRASRDIAARNLRRVAVKRQAVPEWASEFDRLVELEAHALTASRESSTGIAWHVDHMIPLQARSCRGLHVWNNLQVIPAAMNIAKGNKMIFTNPGEWIRHI